jgi:two-component system sensor histidine kinase KdpD
VLAALGLARDDGAPAARPDQFALLDNLLDQVALALERSRLEGEARDFVRVRERDRVRSALLSSIGQDLRPPLLAITKGARQLRRAAAGDKETIVAIEQEAAKLDRYLLGIADLGLDDEPRPIVLGNVTIDLFRRIVLRDGHPVRLTPKEYGVLAELAKQPGRVLAHAHLLRSVWGPAQENQTEYLRVAVRGLRQKLEGNPSNPSLIINE